MLPDRRPCAKRLNSGSIRGLGGSKSNGIKTSPKFTCKHGKTLLSWLTAGFRKRTDVDSDCGSNRNGGGDASITIASSDNGVSVRPKPKFPSKKWSVATAVRQIVVRGNARVYFERTIPNVNVNNRRSVFVSVGNDYRIYRIIFFERTRRLFVARAKCFPIIKHEPLTILVTIKSPRPRNWFSCFVRSDTYLQSYAVSSGIIRN